MVGIHVGHQHFGGARVAFFQAIVLVGQQSGGPFAVGPHPRLGFQRHVGIDERGAPQPAAHQHAYLLVDVEIKQARGRANFAGGRVQLHLRRGFGQRLRKFAGHKLAAPLQQADRAASARQARGGHSPTIPRPNHNDVVVGLNCVQRASYFLHEKKVSRVLKQVGQLVATRKKAFEKGLSQ